MRAAVLSIWMLATSSCSEKDTSSQQQGPTEQLIPTPEALKTREDGLTCLAESTGPTKMSGVTVPYLDTVGHLELLNHRIESSAISTVAEVAMPS